MRGLLNLPIVYNYLSQKEKSLTTIKEILEKEKTDIKEKFDSILKEVTETIYSAYFDIETQIDKFLQYYENTFQLLEKEVDKNFQKSYLSKFKSFEDCLKQVNN